MSYSTFCKMITYMKTFSLSIILGAFLISGSCKTSTLLTTPALVGTWSVLSIADSTSSTNTPNNYPITMKLTSSDSVYSTTLVNGYAGIYSNSPSNGIKVSNLIGTTVYASYPNGAFEVRYINLLRNSTSYLLKGDSLIFYNQKNVYNIHFIKK